MSKHDDETKQILLSFKRLRSKYSTFTFSTAKKYGISSYQLKALEGYGKIQRLDPGIYVVAGYMEDELALISQKYTRGVFSGTTALSLHDLTDEMIWNYQVTFPKGYNPNKTGLNRLNITPRYRSGIYYTEGITTKLTENRNSVKVFSAERSLLDVWEDSKLESSVKKEACQRYLEQIYSIQSFSELERLKQLLYPKSDLLKILEVLL